MAGTEIVLYVEDDRRVVLAIAANDLDAVREYLRLYPGRVNRPDVFQSRLIHHASKAGHADMVKLLIDSGADISALDYGGMRRTALHWACVQGNVGVVEVLVNAGADSKASGLGWQELVKQRACGKHVDTDSPPAETPGSLCANRQCWLALERPRWHPGIHWQFPARFKEAVQLLLAMTHVPQGSANVARVKLSWDCCQEIIARMAYPLSAWL